MTTQPKRRRLEPGIYERLGADEARLGLEIVFKDANGKTRRRAVAGGITQARDELARARARRTRRAPEPDDPRVSFDTVCDAFERAHVASLRPNSQAVYRSALARLRQTFGNRRLTAITKVDVRAFVNADRREGLKANTINSHLSALSAIYSFARDDLGMPVTMPKLKPGERPRPADDQREHRVLTDDEVARVLDACDERTRLFFRFLVETGARQSEALGLITRRVGVDTIAFVEQLARDGDLAPLKTRQSRRTIEITRSLAAALKLAATGGRVFADLDHSDIDWAWRQALKRAGIADPQPTIHDLRHTHVSGLIADGWDPQEIASRIGDTLATTLGVYSREFDSRRRGAQRSAALEARYGMATSEPQQAATDRGSGAGEVADLQAKRGAAR